MPPSRISHQKPKGWVLLLLLILFTGLSLLLIQWYHNEVQFRLQAEAALRFRFVHQQLEGVLAQSVLLLTQHSETQLRTNAFDLSQREPSTFFPDWSIQSKAAKKAPFLKLELQHEGLGDPMVFEALFRFEPHALSSIPWFDSALQSLPQTLPNNLIFSQEQDARLSLQAPRFFLVPESVHEPFDYVFSGNTRFVWTKDQWMVFQGSNAWDLKKFSKNFLRIQVQGDVSVEGSMILHQKKQIFLQIMGNLSLRLPNQPAAFSSPSPHLFVHVTRTMAVQALLPGDRTLQVNGYFWLEEACPRLSSRLDGVYWKGSLACPMDSATLGSVPLHLAHSQPLDKPPAAFMRTVMEFNGIRFLKR